MDDGMTSFEEILSATLRMVRTTWKAPACLFLQLDDSGALRIRVADGLAREKWAPLSLSPDKGAAGKCMSQNAIVETGSLDAGDPLAALLNPLISGSAVKFTLVPV